MMDAKNMAMKHDGMEACAEVFFHRARTPEQIEKRKVEIIDACKKIYESSGFSSVNFKAISEMTSFSRQAIYKYYDTKEEILLDILRIDQKKWEEDMYEILSTYHTLSKHEYAIMLTSIFADHKIMLELTALLLNAMEANISLKKLIDFRKDSVDVYHVLLVSISKYFPTATKEQHTSFTSTVFAFATGLYSMIHMSDKHREAERIADSYYVYPSGTDKESLENNTLFETQFYNGVMLLISSM